MAEAEYTASNLSVLKGLDAVRKRPGMYIGSTSSRGLRHLLWEIADNSVDEALAGHGDEITITLHPDGSVEVRDNGRGMPVDIEPKTGKSGVVVIFTELHAGGKFNAGAYGAAGGLHGVGASVVNALSSRVDVTVSRNKKLYTIGFKEGVPGHYSKDGKFTESEEPQESGKSSHDGTTVRFWPDTKIFQQDAVIDRDEVLSRARQTAFLVPGLTMVVHDLRYDDEIHETYRFDGGTVDFVDYASTAAPVVDTIVARGHGSYTETVPVLDEDTQQLVSTDVDRDMEVDVAFRWDTSYDTHVQSFVNVVATPKGGTHVNGFERSLTKIVNEYMRSLKVLKTSEDNVVKDDVLEGLTAIILVRIAEPQFEGQTKEILGTSAASRIVANVLAEACKLFFESPKNKQAAKQALEKVHQAAVTRKAARAHRENIRRKSAIESSGMPSKLRDCRSHDLEESELFLIEGDSAGGTAVGARDSKSQAMLPLRGKILNTLKAPESKMLKNEECVAIITAMGGGYGKSFDLDSIRYGKLILMADADADGDHIRCLLLSLIWKYMRPLLVAGRVYSAVPPLFEIEISGSKGRVEYAFTPDEMQEKLKDLKKEGIPESRITVGRLKGLGEQEADSLATTTIDKTTRTLRRITLDEAEESASRALQELMGTAVEPRREFIMDRGDLLEVEDLDLSA